MVAVVAVMAIHQIVEYGIMSFFQLLLIKRDVCGNGFITLAILPSVLQTSEDGIDVTSP